MGVEAIYIAASPNRQANVSSISSSSLLAFGTHKLIALWDLSDPSDRGVFQTIPGHDAEVTCVEWISEGGSFCSADESGFLRVWKVSSNGKWETVTKAHAHLRTISALKYYRGFIVTGSSDATIKVWSFRPENNELFLSQTIDMKGKFPLSVELSQLPNSSSLIMAVGSTDRKIRIFTRSEDQFISSLSLEGHEDWVKCLSFSPSPTDGDNSQTLILASGSQDGYIRLWAIAPSLAPSFSTSSGSAPIDDLMDAFEKNLGELADDAEEGGKSISIRSHVFSISDEQGSSKARQLTLTFDALLIGHEAAVTSLAWRPPQSRNDSVPTLLSTSTDSSLILWSPTTLPTTTLSSGVGITNSLWTNRQRFGDVGGVKAGGFVGGLWAPNGREVLGWGWNGGWRRWKDVFEGAEGIQEAWVEAIAPLGHNGPVRGLAWDPSGNHLISTSLDQTTRIHGSWKRPIDPSTSPKSDGTVETWHEVARPQIHGYDLIGATFVTPFQFVSVADEKVARVFNAPQGFLRTIGYLRADEQLTVEAASRPLGAILPPLGLSNKATDDTEAAEPIYTSTSAALSRPPIEPELASTTLWPEVEKLFGHGYELITIASSHSGRLIATACKSTSATHAVVRLYDTTTWRPVGEPLTGHALTVTRIAFSRDDKLILTVSRDRTWRLFELQENGGYTPLCHEKPHARIIWDCAWSHENDLFATAARDKSVKIWRKELSADNKWTSVQTLKLEEGATAIDFLPLDSNQCRRVAVGLESGQVVIYASKMTTGMPGEWTLEMVLDQTITHVDQVHRLAWRPGREDLAVCSEDRSLRILRFSFASSLY